MELDHSLLDLIAAAEKLANMRFSISSAYREGDPRSHGTGYAVDITALSSRTRYKILRAVLRVGFTRVGIYPSHIHVDVDPSRDPDVCWVHDE